MGRGNVSVSGPYEGLYYIDNDDFHVYRRDDLFSGETETRLKGELSREDFAGSEWVYDESGTAEEERDILDWFMNSFTRMFPSFRRPADELWIRNGSWGDYSRKVILENKLFYITVEDNEWSLAVELLQKENPNDNRLRGLQSRYFQKYLEEIKNSFWSGCPASESGRVPGPPELSKAGRPSDGADDTILNKEGDCGP